jgi:hypothetical protein
MSAVDATALVPLQSIPGAGTDRHRRIPALALLLVVAALGVAVAGLATLGGGETGRPPSTTSVMAPVVTGPVSMPATAAPPPTEPVGQPIDATPGGASPDGTARTDGEAPSGVEGEGRAKGQGKEKDDKRGPKR